MTYLMKEACTYQLHCSFESRHVHIDNSSSAMPVVFFCRADGNTTEIDDPSCRFAFHPLNFLNRLVRKAATALRMRKRRSRVSSAGRSSSRPPCLAPSDAQRTEAIEDCIKFINSSSLPRSSSVTEKSW